MKFNLSLNIQKLLLIGICSLAFNSNASQESVTLIKDELSKKNTRVSKINKDIPRKYRKYAPKEVYAINSKFKSAAK